MNLRIGVNVANFGPHAGAAAHLAGTVHRWRATPGVQALTSAPFYATYECADGRRLAVAAIEPRCYAALLTVLGLDPAALPDRADPSGWPALAEAFAVAVRTRDRDEWAKVFADVDACVEPVLEPH